MRKSLIAFAILAASGTAASAGQGVVGTLLARLEARPQISTPIPTPGELQEARSGCCSHHGGVAGCDTATGHQACRDGSDSPSCDCGEVRR